MMGLWWWWVLASRRLSAMVFNEVSLRFRVVFMEEKREGGAHAMHKLSLFFFFYHFSLFFIGRIWLICVQNQVPQEYLLFFFFFLAKQAVPIDLKPTHCFWAQILILSSACASCNTFEHEFWAKCKISNFKIEYLWRYLKYHSYLICTLKWSDQYCN